jgi:selenocysteine lyase/cysteine desulfurase
MVGTAAAIDFLASLAGTGSKRARLIQVYDELHQRNARLVQRLWEGLSAVPGVRLYGPAPGSAERTPTISFTIKARASTEVARALAAKGMFLSHGDFYAFTVVERLQLAPEGLVRAGCACYTTLEEIERLIDGVREIARR